MGILVPNGLLAQSRFFPDFPPFFIPGPGFYTQMCVFGKPRFSGCKKVHIFPTFLRAGFRISGISRIPARIFPRPCQISRARADFPADPRISRILGCPDLQVSQIPVSGVTKSSKTPVFWGSQKVTFFVIFRHFSRFFGFPGFPGFSGFDCDFLISFWIF